MTGTAPQRLRDLAQAASEDHPGPWHIVMDELQDAQGEVVMTPYDGAHPSGWRLIATVASPDRVLLLDALSNVRGKHFVENEHVQAFENALRALEAAITAGGES